MKKTHLIIHRSLVPYNGSDQFNGINNYHKRQGFPKSALGYYCGYQYLIEGDGKVKQVRNDEEIGAHCYQKGMNRKSIGICMSGNFDKDEPTKEQIEALEKLIKKLQKKHGISDGNIQTHRTYATYKSCPGNNIENDILGYIKRKTEKNEVSAWAKPSVQKAIDKGIAVQWDTPQEIVANAVTEHIFYNLGHIKSLEGNMTKERLIVALDNAGLL